MGPAAPPSPIGESELPPVIRLRLKIEINTREHLCLHPVQQTAFSVDSRWFTGEATLPIYSTTELLGTKLRALYQRRKGRDLFDLWLAHQAGVLDAPAVADAFGHYMAAENRPVIGGVRSQSHRQDETRGIPI